MKVKICITALLLFIVCLVGTARAQTPRVVRYGAQVRDAAGAVQTGAVTLTFAIYADAEGGTALWTEAQPVALDAQGRYSVLLGAATADGLPSELFAKGDARWLGVSVNGGVEMARVALVSVPYALKAADADKIGGKPLSAFVLTGDKTGVGSDGLTYVGKDVINKALTGQVQPMANSGSAGYIGVFTNTTDLGNSVMYQLGSNIGVGTTTPAATLNVVSPSAPAVFFDVISPTLGALPAIYRAARGTPGFPAAVQANDILGGLAVRGHTGIGFSEGKGQVMFKAAENWTPTANGTYLQFTTTPIGSTTFAERMRIDPSGNIGIGTATPAYRLDVVGSVQVQPPNTTGSTGISVVNANTTADGVAVYSEGDGVDAYGTLGSTDSGVAVGGIASDTVNGYAGLFSGDVGVGNNLYVLGTLYKGGGAFRIDHPLDPQNMYLNHSFVESPDMKNIYDGVAVLDGAGEATVTLPAWFEALNEDFRYQLTPIGAAFVPYIAEEIAGNQFRIAGGVPGKKVSWQVTGIRHDAYANAHRIQVEEMKSGSAVGTYLHPDAFGEDVQKPAATSSSRNPKAKAVQELKAMKVKLRSQQDKSSTK